MQTIKLEIVFGQCSEDGKTTVFQKIQEAIDLENQFLIYDKTDNLKDCRELKYFIDYK